MSRFFLPPDTAPPGQPLARGTTVTFEADDAPHIARVLRLGPGDVVTGVLHGWEYEIKLTVASPKHIAGEVVAGRAGDTEPPLRVLVAQGMPKADKFDLVVQKATELGAAGIVAVSCERSVVRLDADRAENRLARWSRIAREAAQQCRRVVVPAVLPPVRWHDALAFGGAGTLRLVPWEGPTTQSLKDVLTKTPPPRDEADWDVIIYIGPEGGLANGEIAAAESAGAIPVSLGPRILRTETAAVATLAMVLCAWGDLGG